mmetsp:Transcript_58629/g.110308  ORF Transcript_58629/g.110308 Transcript_58629/m.110308 type:complete len:561 (-) Transcript_58629:78-1760(-)
MGMGKRTLREEAEEAPPPATPVAAKGKKGKKQAAAAVEESSEDLEKKTKKGTKRPQQEEVAAEQSEQSEKKRARKEAKRAAALAAQEVTQPPASPSEEVSAEQDKQKRVKKEAKMAAAEAKKAAGEAKSEVPPEDVTATAMSADEFRAKMLITSRTAVELPDPVQTFDDAPFSKKLRAALKAAGFTAPSAIQAQGWPVAVRGDDMIAVAKTGSGKTLGFLLPAFRRIAKEQPDCSTGPAILVLAPTRELVVQIEEAAAKFGQSASVSTVVVYGGVPKPPQAQALRSKPQLVVATPGRLLDLMNDGAVKLGNACFLVLDEADRMLDMGFEPQMEQIMKKIPAERQTLLFSATWPKSVQKLARNYLKKEAVHVNVGETEELAANKAVTQEFFKLDDDEKEEKLFRIISALPDDSKIIVFANTKRRIDKLEKLSWEFGWNSVAMHGDKSQKDRDAGYARFLSGEAPLMVATDVCARGLDIKGVSHVVNFDMARDVEGYIHRIGRTGRAGASGTSITFVNHAYDTECAPALVKIAREAGATVPEWLDKLADKGRGGKQNKLWKY